MGHRAVVIVDPLSTGTPLVEESRRCGYAVCCVYTTSMRSAAKGDLEVVSRSADEVASAVRAASLDVAAVLPGSEPGVELAEEFASRVGVRTNSRASSAARRDKYEMRRAVAAAGLNNIPHFRCVSSSDVVAAAEAIGWPVMVKTPRSTGTNHVFMCHHMQEALNAHATILSTPDLFGQMATCTIVERCVAGPEYAVNIFATDSGFRLLDVWRYEKVDTPQASHLYLNAFQMGPGEAPAEVVTYSFAVARATGLVIGPAHVEVRLTDAGPVLMEIGSRLPGGTIPSLWRRFSNFEPYASTLSSYVDGDVALAPFRCDKRLGICFVHNKSEGTVQGFLGLEAIEQLPSYAGHLLRNRAGDRVRLPVDLSTIPLYVDLAHHDSEQLLHDAKAAHRVFDVRV